MGKFDEVLTVDGQQFELLGMQRSGAAVYRGETDFLRIGPKDAIERDANLHRVMAKAKFPVTPIVSEGDLGERAYFVERSAGGISFRSLFQEDVEEKGSIEPAHFDAFLAVMKKLYKAQKRTAEGSWDVDAFAEGINLPKLCGELPMHAAEIRARFDEAMKRLAKLPRTLLHGDCNPSNAFAGAIIDLEDSFYGPLGYDIVSAVATIDWFPLTRDYEFYARYDFTDAHIQAYYKAFPEIAPHAKDLAFCRAAWLCSGMGEWPRIQQWRFEKFVSDYLS